MSRPCVTVVTKQVAATAEIKHVVSAQVPAARGPKGRDGEDGEDGDRGPPGPAGPAGELGENVILDGGNF